MGQTYSQSKHLANNMANKHMNGALKRRSRENVQNGLGIDVYSIAAIDSSIIWIICHATSNYLPIHLFMLVYLLILFETTQVLHAVFEQMQISDWLHMYAEKSVLRM